jgi:Lhr-like helicase
MEDSSQKKKRGRKKKKIETPDTPVPVRPLDMSSKNKRGRKKKPSAAVSTTPGLLKILSNDMGGGV